MTASNHGCSRTPVNGFCCGMDERIPVFADAARNEYFTGPIRKDGRINNGYEFEYNPVWLYSVATGKLEYTFVGRRLPKRYLALCHLWKHNNFPELHGGDLDAMTEADWGVFREKVRRILAAVAEELEITEPMEHVWLDQASVDQKDRESVRTAMYSRDHCFSCAECTVLCLPGVEPTTEVKECRSSLWAMQVCKHLSVMFLFISQYVHDPLWQELLVSRKISVFLLNGQDSSGVNIEEIREESKLSWKVVRQREDKPLQALMGKMLQRQGGWPLDKIYAVRHLLHSYEIQHLPFMHDRTIDDMIWMLYEDKAIELDEALYLLWMFGLSQGLLFPLLNRRTVTDLHPTRGVGITSKKINMSPWSNQLLAGKTLISDWKEGDEFVLYVALNIEGKLDPESNNWQDKELQHLLKEFSPSETTFLQTIFCCSAEKEAYHSPWRRGFGDGPPAQYNYKRLGQGKKKGLQLAMKAIQERWAEIESGYVRSANEDQTKDDATRKTLRDVIVLHLKTHPDIQSVDWGSTIAISRKRQWWLLDATPNVALHNWKVRGARLADSKITAWFCKFQELFTGIESNVSLTADPGLRIPIADLGEDRGQEQNYEVVFYENLNEHVGIVPLSKLPPHSCSRKPRNGFCCGMDSKIAGVASAARDEYFAGDALNEPQYVDRRYQPVWLYCLETGDFEYTFVGPRLRKGYLALSHLWKHNIFPELRRGLIETMTETDWTTFNSKVKSICAEIIALSGLESSEIDYIWLDEACVDQSDKEAIRSATYIMSYVYEWAKATVVCLPGAHPEEEMQEWLSSTWTMQELVYSKNIVVHFLVPGTGVDKELQRRLSQRANSDAERFRGMYEKDESGLVAEMQSRKGGWPLDKLYAIRHVFKGLKNIPVTYDRDIQDVLLLLIEDCVGYDASASIYVRPPEKYQADNVKGYKRAMQAVFTRWKDIESQYPPLPTGFADWEWDEPVNRILDIIILVLKTHPDLQSVDWTGTVALQPAQIGRCLSGRALDNLQPPKKYQADEAGGFETALQAVLARNRSSSRDSQGICAIPPEIRKEYALITGFSEEETDEIVRLHDIIAISLQTHPSLQDVDWVSTIALQYYDGVFLPDAKLDFERRCWEITGGRIAEPAVAKVLNAFKEFVKLVQYEVFVSAEHRGLDIFPAVDDDDDIVNYVD
ncbi:hypothetical protein HDU96_008467 [Phlyctochytrium bullatum]|nr:hypothetical protein HDU96_008467 [Phlyctochytrium bullatum]